MMADLSAFLAARLDEDEAALRAIEDNSEPWRGQWAPDDMNFALRTRNGWSLARAVTVEEGFPPGVLAHIVRHDPARVLREVEAKREILRRHAPDGSDPANCLWCSEYDRPYCWPCPDVLSLTAVYSDHADYRPEWKP